MRENSDTPFIYLDNAATTQKPEVVLTAYSDYYRKYCANVHRSPHKIGEEATERFEAARSTVGRFIGIDDPARIIFTSGATGSLNLISNILTNQLLRHGDVILLTPSEHHSNLVPWQMAASRSGALLQFIDLMPDGTFDYDSIERNWDSRTKVFSFQHASNVTGAIHDVDRLCRIARSQGALSIVDGAQSAAHIPVDIASIGCDFYAFSGHKCIGPTGIGVLAGRRDLLESFHPVFGGGEMILKVRRDSSTYNDIPYKFEPGTPNIAGAIGLGAALEFLNNLGMKNIQAYVESLGDYAMNSLSSVVGLTPVGPKSHRTGAISFNIAGCHPHDIASILDAEGIAIRAGAHCAEPLMETLGIASTARASFYFYNTFEEADRLVEGLNKAKGILRQ